MSIKSLPLNARPREKLLLQGATSLADAELLALLLRTGVKGMGVLQLAESLLQRFGGFSGLLHARLGELRGVHGIGPAKRAELAAVVEIARRALTEQLAAAPVLNSKEALHQFARMALGRHGQEAFVVLFLDVQMRLLKHEEMFRGTLGHVTVYPREIVRRALSLNAAAVVLAHNHPHGLCQPSRADELITQAIQTALALVDVRVVDHLVVGQDEVASFVDMGLL